MWAGVRAGPRHRTQGWPQVGLWLVGLDLSLYVYVFAGWLVFVSYIAVFSQALHLLFISPPAVCLPVSPAGPWLWLGSRC